MTFAKFALLAGLAVSFAPGFAFAHSTLRMNLEMPQGSIGESTRMKVVLWGYDRLLADARASLLKIVYRRVEGTPQFYGIPVERLIHRDIDQGNGIVPRSRASYYVTVFVDANGDGQICPGDYRQNFEVQEPVFFQSFPSPLLRMPMTQVEAGRACEIF